MELEQEPLIRSITINVRDVFEGENLAWIYRAANKVKINSRKEIIKRELLFKEGQIFDELLLKESERNLRSLRFVHKVAVTPSFDGNFVDIEVTVQDTWTLIPVANFSSGSGSDDRTEVGVAESNLLGYGKRIELKYEENDGQDEYQAVWDDSRLAGTQNRLLAGYFDRSDGFRYVSSIGRPFRSLVEKNSWIVRADVSDTVGRLFEGGDERFVFSNENIDLAAGYTFARGNAAKRIHRYTIGYEFVEDLFFEATDQDFEDIDVDPTTVSRDPALLADKRRFSAPFFTYQMIEPRFISQNYIDRFERVQDFNLGRQFLFKIGAALESLGSLEDTALFQASHSRGWRFSADSFVRAEISASTRFDGDLENSLLRGQLKYYNFLGRKTFLGLSLGKHTLASSLKLDYADQLDKDKELLLGASTGLRGYESGTFTGDKRFVLNLEDRFVLFEDIYQLVSLGGAFFFDIGGTTSNRIDDLFTDNLYSDVGLGLRVNFPRSSGSKVLRVDLAFPLREGLDGSDTFELRVLLVGGQAFNASLPSEAILGDNIGVGLGF